MSQTKKVSFSTLPPPLEESGIVPSTPSTTIYSYDDSEATRASDLEEESDYVNHLIDRYEHKESFLLSLVTYCDQLEDDDFVIIVNQTIQERMHLLLENKVFLDFLNANEPQILSAYPQAMNTIRALEEANPLLPVVFNAPPEEITASTWIFSDLGARINITSRNDLVLRCVEEMEELLNKFMTLANSKKFHLRAIIEESEIRSEEVIHARHMFEEAMDAAIDPLTARIPAEKFSWFMEEWLKSARQITEKLRLRNNSLKTTFKKAKQVYDQKSELGIRLHTVDFDQYHIENKYLIMKIEQSNQHLLELKQFTGRANLDLARMKRALQRILTGIKEIHDSTAAIEKDIINLQKECEIASKEVADSKAIYEKVKKLVTNCRAPETIDYVQVKAKQYELLKEKKILERQANLISIMLKQTKQSMLRITGTKVFQKAWLEPHNLYDEDVNFNFGDMEEELHRSHIQLADSYTNPHEFDIFTVIKCSQDMLLKEKMESVVEVKKKFKKRKYKKRSANNKLTVD